MARYASPSQFSLPSYTTKIEPGARTEAQPEPEPQSYRTQQSGSVQNNIMKGKKNTSDEAELGFTSYEEQQLLQVFQLGPEANRVDAVGRGRARSYHVQSKTRLISSELPNQGLKRSASAILPPGATLQRSKRPNSRPSPNLLNESTEHDVKKGTWSPEEDELLLKLIYQNPSRKWSEIAMLVPGRTAKQCRERWSCNLDPSINKAAWTPEEDVIILQLQSKVGNRWAHIASYLSGRTENAVKTRFKSIIRAQKREWTPEEDETLLSLQRRHGSNWDVIAPHLPNRTKNAVKTRYRLLSKGAASKQPELGAPNQVLHQTRGRNLEQIRKNQSQGSLSVVQPQQVTPRAASLPQEAASSPAKNEVSFECPAPKQGQCARFDQQNQPLPVFHGQCYQPYPHSMPASWHSPDPGMRSEYFGVGYPAESAPLSGNMWD